MSLPAATNFIGTMLSARSRHRLEVFWTDGSEAYLRGGGEERALVPSPVSGIVEINCDGPLDRPFVGGQLVQDPHLRAAYGPRVISSTLGVAWVSAGRRAAYVSDGTFYENLHFAAGIAIAQAAGCLISDLAGTSLNTSRGLILGRPSHTSSSTDSRRAPPRSSHQGSLTPHHTLSKVRPRNPGELADTNPRSVSRGTRTLRVIVVCRRERAVRIGGVLGIS